MNSHLSFRKLPPPSQPHNQPTANTLTLPPSTRHRNNLPILRSYKQDDKMRPTAATHSGMPTGTKYVSITGCKSQTRPRWGRGGGGEETRALPLAARLIIRKVDRSASKGEGRAVQDGGKTRLRLLDRAIAGSREMWQVARSTTTGPAGRPARRCPRRLYGLYPPAQTKTRSYGPPLLLATSAGAAQKRVVAPERARGELRLLAAFLSTNTHTPGLCPRARGLVPSLLALRHPGRQQRDALLGWAGMAWRSTRGRTDRISGRRRRAASQTWAARVRDVRREKERRPDGGRAVRSRARFSRAAHSAALSEAGEGRRGCCTCCWHGGQGDRGKAA